jgi:hypothetical protein
MIYHVLQNKLTLQIYLASTATTTVSVVMSIEVGLITVHFAFVFARGYHMFLAGPSVNPPVTITFQKLNSSENNDI